jgi:uncharacterized protein YjbI with pentapeptide repeats
VSTPEIDQFDPSEAESAVPDAVDPVAPDVDLVGAQLAGLDLSGRDLSGRDLTNANLAGADLSRARLVGAKLGGAILTDAKLSDAQLLGCDLSKADLTGAEAPRAVLGRANLTDAVLFNADLEHASLSHADLSGADLRVAKLNEARLREANLTHADVSRAELRDADLTRAEVGKAVFRDADLGRSRVKELTGYSTADWIGVDILDVDFAGAYLARRTIMDQNYLHEFRHKSRVNAFVYQIWSITSDCGRSYLRWALWTILLAAIFSVAFMFVDIDYGEYESWLSPVYYSVVTFTTLGYGDAVPASTAAQILAMLEVVMGYVMLGGLLSIFATKMGRRAE